MKGLRTMADEAPKKRRAPQGPRTPRPIFAILNASDSEGNAVDLNALTINVAFERDAGKLVELLTSGQGVGGKVIRVELPAPAQRAKKAE